MYASPLLLLSLTLGAYGSHIDLNPCPSSALVARSRVMPLAIRASPENSCQFDTDKIRKLEAKGCNVLACIAAGAGTVAACATAGAMDGLDPIADAACLAAASATFKQCSGCAG